MVRALDFSQVHKKELREEGAAKFNRKFGIKDDFHDVGSLLAEVITKVGETERSNIIGVTSD